MVSVADPVPEQPCITRAVDPDPHSFSLLGTDPGGKNLREKTQKHTRKSVVIVISFKK